MYNAVQLATMLNSKRSHISVVDNDKQPCRPVHPLPYRTIYQELIWSKLIRHKYSFYKDLHVVCHLGNRTVIAASSAAVVGVVAGYPVSDLLK